LTLGIKTNQFYTFKNLFVTKKDIWTKTKVREYTKDQNDI
jgi:hypothetical protein